MDLKKNENPECAEPCSSGLASLSSVAAPIRKRRFSSAKIQPELSFNYKGNVPDDIENEALDENAFQTRVKRVMQSDEEIGRMVASVPVAIGRAMEHFAEKLLEAAARCVQCSTSRTLSPSHMKQAVLQNRHFMFLEPLMREIPLPPSAGPELPWRTDWVEQPSFSGFHAPGSVLDSSCHIGMPVPLSQMGFPKLSSSGSQLGTKRRQSNGEVDGNETKPKRGRPRKMKKEDRCVDDDGLLMEEKPPGYQKDGNTSNGSVLTDRELMPPPSMLPVRALAATAMSDSKRNLCISSPHSSTMNSVSNGEQRKLFTEQADCVQSSLPTSSSALPSSADTGSTATTATPS